MPICGAVLHLSERAELRQAALDALARDSRITLGEPQGTRLPVVFDTVDAREDDELWREVLRIDGVMHADVVVASFDDAAQE